jgi:hypothetical protein
VDWFQLGHVRVQWLVLVKKVMNTRFPLKAGNLFTSCTTVSF